MALLVWGKMHHKGKYVRSWSNHGSLESIGNYKIKFSWSGLPVLIARMNIIFVGIWSVMCQYKS